LSYLFYSPSRILFFYAKVNNDLIQKPAIIIKKIATSGYNTMAAKFFGLTSFEAADIHCSPHFFVIGHAVKSLVLQKYQLHGRILDVI